MASTTPAFNLKVVLKETGIAADTLRAWERRYGLPMPQRSAGGHRLYSQRDIETIKWLMKRQEDGLSISRAVDLWNEQIASGTDPLADLAQTGSASTMPVLLTSPDTTLDTLRAQWVEACLNFSESTAEQVLNQAFSIFPVEAVCIEVLQRGMFEIGERWYENRATVQQEHFASALATRRLDALLIASPAPTREQTVLVGSPPNEWHTLTSLLLSLLLRRRGWKVIYLGANVPAEQFTNTVKDIGAELVVLVAQQLITAATLQHTAQVLSSQAAPVAFGGRIFNTHPSMHASISGYYLGQDLLIALDQIETLLSKKLRLPQPKAASPSHIAAYQVFVSQRSEIELSFRERMKMFSVAPDNLPVGIHFLGENITAALQLGDIGYVSGEVEWLKALLQFHGAESGQLIHFMQAYSEAVKKHLNSSGKLIYEWLDSEVEKLRTG
ncbi:MAG TPA: B12-binding domain-containing protein [Anaerolineales bacterium]|jgi:methanogenic corrinoid protein MtbC1|nr:B12-binding domain-containing protein [Anaerolineales bacterium]